MPAVASEMSQMVIPQHAHQFREITGPKLNLGCGHDVRSADAGWVNMDGFILHPGVTKHDLLEFPWPFPDGHFDLVYCSHVLEHVPPIAGPKPGTKRDILFDVFEEIHRVLKPGGLLCIRVPWGYTEVSLEHIQHYRQWRPEWANYFDPQHEENGYSTARFKLEWWKRTRALTTIRGKYALRFGRTQKLSLTTHLRDRLPFLRWIIEKPSELEMRMRKV